MSLGNLLHKIRKNSLKDIKRKLSDRLWNKYILFIHRHVAKIPCAEAWQAQWFTYNKIVKNYINASYDLSKLFPEGSSVPDEKNVWVYWNTGIETAPEIVKKCFAQLQKNIPEGYRLILLTKENVHSYVKFPSFVQDKLARGRISQAHFSDMLRAALIYRYGGIWFDATCLLTRKIPDRVLNSKFFVFQANRLTMYETYPPIKCSSWFIASSIRNCRILERTLQVLLAYWQTNERILHYYLYHIVVAAVVDNDEQSAKIWKEMPYICNMDPHVLMYSFENNYSESEWQNAMESCFVHKLTYKFDKKLMDSTTENILQHLTRSF